MRAAMPTARAAEAELLLQGLALAVPPHSALFVSGPVSSGPRFYAAAAPVDPVQIWRDNAMDIERLAERLRNRFGCLVICPSALIIEGWRGRDYGAFFAQVLERFVRQAWFADGWELSVGALRELVLCASRSIPCHTQDGSVLTLAAAHTRAESALRGIADRRLISESLVEAVAALRQPPAG